ncbi:MAG: glycosyltransferase-like protein [Myxococcales bacterium]|nr:glycosyltransferase-like protein [Myxococcales bacterium]
MRRVLIVGALPPPSGGVATHCRELARALEAAGLRVDLIDPRRVGPAGRDGRPRLLARLALARLRREIVHVHTNGHNRGSWTVAALCGLGHTGASILTLHSGLAPDYIRKHRTLARLVAGRYSAVVAVNEAIAAALTDAGVAPSKIVVSAAFTPSSLAFRLSPPGLAQIRRAHPLLIACALAPGPEYGAAVMLDAFAAVRAREPRAGLVIYGPGTREPALAAAVRARGLGGAVHQLGEMARERALAIVAAADVFVRPTLADGDAISVREALALGRPAVASNVGARPPEAKLFPVGDSAACAEQIFQSLATRLPEYAHRVDCLPTLLDLYGRVGAEFDAVATGTALAKGM